MKTKIKKILAVMLTAILMLTPAIAGTASATGDGTHENLTYISDGSKAVITDCKADASGKITVPETINGSTVVAVGREAFMECKEITEVVLPDTVVKIDHRAFQYCDKLEYINLPSGITKIADFAFLYCKKLNNVVLPSGLKEIGYNCFYGCDSIEKIVIPDSVKFVDRGAFAECDNLRSLTIGSGLESMYEMSFNGNINLTELVIKNGVKNIGRGAFGGNTKLASVTIPDSVTVINESAFARCEALTSIVIPETVKTIEKQAFLDCKNLADITIHDSVEEIGIDAFTGTAYYNEKNNWSDELLYVGNHLIGCSYPQSGGNAPYTCIIREGTKTIAGGVFDTRYNMEEAVIPSSVVSIGDEAFRWCFDLKKVVLSEGLEKIGEYAFYNCYNLTDITLPDSLTSIDDRAFLACSVMNDVSLPSNLTHLGDYAFSGTPYYENPENWKDGILYIGDQIITAGTAVIHGTYTIKDGTVFIPDGTFSSTYINEIVIPDSVKHVGDSAFAGCSGLTKLTVGSNADNIGGSAGITKIFVSKDNPYYSSDSYGNLYSKDKTVFYHYASGGNDESFTVPSTVKTISEGAFMFCDTLKRVTIGNSVEEIEFGAFEFCDSIERVIIGKNVSKIDGQAFDIHYQSDPEVFYEGNEIDWNLISWEANNEKVRDARITYNFDTNSIGKSTTVSVSASDGSASVDYGKTKEILAAVTDMPDGAYIRWTVNGNALELNNDYTGCYCYVKAINGGTDTVKAQVVDQNGNPVENACAEITITVNDGIFQRIAAFFENLIARILALFSF